MASFAQHLKTSEILRLTSAHVCLSDLDTKGMTPMALLVRGSHCFPKQSPMGGNLLNRDWDAE